MSSGPVFLRACRGEKVPHTPVWLMRQAGRYMAEYRAVREKVSFLELCKTPELACEVTVFACERIGADAAILFADILLIIETLGLNLTFEKGDGPRIHDPVRTAEDLRRVREVDPDELGYVYEAVRQIRAALKPEVALIGFAGAPFTVASYMVEGGSTREFIHTKRLMYAEPQAWHELMGYLARGTNAYLRRQVAAGAQAVQLFDSWVGNLSPADYEEYVLPYSRQALAGLDVPTIHFGRGTGLLLEKLRSAGGDVIGVDFMTPIADARQRLGKDVPVQGNLDPAVLLSGRDVIRAKTRQIVDDAGSLGHIFNLGHGIVPQTPVDDVKFLIDLVHELSSK